MSHWGKSGLASIMVNISQEQNNELSPWLFLEKKKLFFLKPSVKNIINNPLVSFVYY